MNFLAFIPLLVTVLVETTEQLTFKASTKFRTYRVHLLALGVMLHGVQLLAWFVALTLLPLGIATPLMGATYVTVSVGSRVFFGEQIDKRRWIGIVSIVLGLALISRAEA
jgi:drug/metabolite transporter (DMT)-like permease